MKSAEKEEKSEQVEREKLGKLMEYFSGRINHEAFEAKAGRYN